MNNSIDAIRNYSSQQWYTTLKWGRVSRRSRKKSPKECWMRERIKWRQYVGWWRQRFISRNFHWNRWTISIRTTLKCSRQLNSPVSLILSYLPSLKLTVTVRSSKGSRNCKRNSIVVRMNPSSWKKAKTPSNHKKPTNSLWNQPFPKSNSSLYPYLNTRMRLLAPVIMWFRYNLKKA